MSETKTHKIRDIFTEGPIAPAFIAESIAKHSTRHDIGAHEIFLGQVRADSTGGKFPAPTAAIEYTAYRDMANEQMIAIREEAFGRWPITCLHVHHSLGVIRAGADPCLAVRPRTAAGGASRRAWRCART